MQDRNPWVTLPLWVYIPILVYVLHFTFLLPTIQFASYADSGVDVFCYLADMLAKLAIAFPLFICRRPNIGIFHPLVLPALFNVAKGIVKAPSLLLSPFHIASPSPVGRQGLWQLTEVQVLLTGAYHDLLICLGLVVLYIAYFSIPRLWTPELKLSVSRMFVPKVLLVAAVGFLAGAYIIKTQGGITESIYAMGFGRFKQRDALGGGHFQVIATLLTTACYLWFGYRAKAKYNPFFWGLFALSIVTMFVITGSRSSILIQGLTIICFYILRTRKIPYTTIALTGAVGVVLIGVLGRLRTSSYTEDELKWEVVTEVDVGASVESAYAEIAARPSGSHLIVGEAMERTGPLWGRTYLGAVFFFVPRFLWPDKPRGGGAYANSLLLNDTSLESAPAGGSGQSIPISWQAEAYWNFYIFGVVVVACLAGLFYKFMACLFLRYQRWPIIWLVYMYSILTFKPQSDGVIVFIQNLVLLLVVAILLRLWNPVSFSSSPKPSLA